MEEALPKYLLASSGLTALIGQRIDWAARPQASALPALVLHMISGAPEYDDDGEVGLFTARIQFDCWGATYLAAKNVARQVKARLSGKAFVQDGIEFQAAFFENEQDSRESAAGAEELYRVRLDCILWHKQEN